MKESFIAQNDNDVIIASSSGKIVRCNAGTISITGRSAQGVKIISLESNERVTSVTKVDGSKEDEQEFDENTEL